MQVQKETEQYESFIEAKKQNKTNKQTNKNTLHVLGTSEQTEIMPGSLYEDVAIIPFARCKWSPSKVDKVI